MCESLLRRTKYCQKGTDVWAFGVLQYFALKKKFPFKGQNELDLVKNIKELNIDYTSINAVWVDLLKKIFVPDSERITMENVRFFVIKWYLKLIKSCRDSTH